MVSPLAHASDHALLARFSENGDESAFAEIVRRYADHVYSASLRVLGDPALAEDATQETFFTLMRKPRAVRQSLGGWLHRSATRQAIDRVRQDSNRRRREQRYARAHDRSRVEEEVTWASLSPYVDQALNALPARSRDVLVNHFLHDRTLTELAGEAGVSKATMSRRCKDALARLRRELSKRGVIAGAAGLAAALSAHTVEAAPAASSLVLRKMAMASGAVAEAAAPAASVYVSWKAVAWTAVVLLACGVAAGLMLLDIGPAASPRAVDEPVVASPGQLAASRALFLTIPSAAGSLDADTITTFQNPRTVDGDELAVVFGDGHVDILTMPDLRAALEAQTGRPFDDILKAAQPVTPAGAPQ